jgi:hypothetical protein
MCNPLIQSYPLIKNLQHREAPCCRYSEPQVLHRYLRFFSGHLCPKLSTLSVISTWMCRAGRSVVYCGGDSAAA